MHHALCSSRGRESGLCVCRIVHLHDAHFFCPLLGCRVSPRATKASRHELFGFTPTAPDLPTLVVPPLRSTSHELHADHWAGMPHTSPALLGPRGFSSRDRSPPPMSTGPNILPPLPLVMASGVLGADMPFSSMAGGIAGSSPLSHVPAQPNSVPSRLMSRMLSMPTIQGHISAAYSSAPLPQPPSPTATVTQHRVSDPTLGFAQHVDWHPHRAQRAGAPPGTRVPHLAHLGASGGHFSSAIETRGGDASGWYPDMPLSHSPHVGGSLWHGMGSHGHDGFDLAPPSPRFHVAGGDPRSCALGEGRGAFLDDHPGMTHGDGATSGGFLHSIGSYGFGTGPGAEGLWPPGLGARMAASAPERPAPQSGAEGQGRQEEGALEPGAHAAAGAVPQPAGADGAAAAVGARPAVAAQAPCHVHSRSTGELWQHSLGPSMHGEPDVWDVAPAHPHSLSMNEVWPTSTGQRWGDEDSFVDKHNGPAPSSEGPTARAQPLPPADEGAPGKGDVMGGSEDAC